MPAEEIAAVCCGVEGEAGWWLATPSRYSRDRSPDVAEVMAFVASKTAVACTWLMPNAERCPVGNMVFNKASGMATSKVDVLSVFHIVRLTYDSGLKAYVLSVADEQTIDLKFGEYEALLADDSAEEDEAIGVPSSQGPSPASQILTPVAALALTAPEVPPPIMLLASFRDARRLIQLTERRQTELVFSPTHCCRCRGLLAVPTVSAPVGFRKSLPLAPKRLIAITTEMLKEQHATFVDALGEAAASRLLRLVCLCPTPSHYYWWRAAGCLTRYADVLAWNQLQQQGSGKRVGKAVILGRKRARPTQR